MIGRASSWLANDVSALIQRWATQLGEMLLSPRSQFSIGAITVVLGIAVAVTLSGRRNGRNVPLKVIARALFPRRLVRSASGKADIGFFLFNVLLGPMLFGWAILTSVTVEETVRSFLISTLGEPEETSLPFMFCAAAMTLAGYLAYEFGYWLDHFLKHKLPFFWAVHKVHHSAESLSPLTNFRVHPIDSIVFYNIVAFLMGSTEALINYAFGHPTAPFNIWGRNILLLAGGILLTHLQHTHLWLSFTGRLGKLILSPAHHQIHHSINPAHYDRNFGSTLAVWDLLFGTLYVPSKRREKLTFGVEELGYDPHTAKGGLLTPLTDAWLEIRPLPKVGRPGLSRVQQD